MWAFISPLPCKTPTSTTVCAMPLFLLCHRLSLSRSRLPRSNPLVVLPRFSRPSCVHPFSPLFLSLALAAFFLFPRPAAAACFFPASVSFFGVLQAFRGILALHPTLLCDAAVNGRRGGGGACVRRAGRDGEASDIGENDRGRRTGRHVYMAMYVRLYM